MRKVLEYGDHRETFSDVAVLVGVMVAPALSSAQDATGRIYGTVYDQLGAVIPGEQITVTDTATQTSRVASTDKVGLFQILGLPIGNYKVTAEHAGFRSLVGRRAETVNQRSASHRLQDASGARRIQSK